jgi:amidohydrolase
VTVATINGGVRSNIISDSVTMTGTIRTLNETMRKDIHARVVRTAESIAAASGGRADARVTLGLPVTVNDPALTAWAAPTLERVAGADKAYPAPPSHEAALPVGVRALTHLAVEYMSKGGPARN